MNVAMLFPLSYSSRSATDAVCTSSHTYAENLEV